MSKTSESVDMDATTYSIGSHHAIVAKDGGLAGFALRITAVNAASITGIDRKGVESTIPLARIFRSNPITNPAILGFKGA